MNDYEAILRSGNRGLYALAVLASTVLGAALIRRDSSAWPLSRRDRILVLAGVILGSLVGCAIPAFFAGGAIEKLAWTELVTPKTVLGGLLFGFLGAAVMKRVFGISYDTSDAFARGGCLLMAVGRLGCVAQHCCFGRPTDSFLGWDFGDGHPRWPVQAIEAVLLFGLFAVMEVLHRRRLLEHRRLFVLFAAYGSLRFGLEFLREPLASSWMGIGYYQALALAVAATGLFQISRRTRQKGIRIDYSGPLPELSRRQILGRPAPAFFQEALSRAGQRQNEPFVLSLGQSLLFDESGLRVLTEALRAYRGAASEIGFRLRLDPAAHRDYYSLGSDLDDAGTIPLPVEARRSGAGRDTIVVELRYSSAIPTFPRSLAEPAPVMTPLALLMDYQGDIDLLFANQIALFSRLARDVPRSLRAWVRALFSGRSGDVKRRLSLAYARIHPTADVHPTAVIEGSVIEANVRIGAHAVVRYSHIAERAVLHDGAKVEFSVVGPGSWLMHDLVCVRCLLEDEVFLIHGPYQFSSFQSGSAAFATIMMDYRPDGRPIRVATRSGIREYGGRFLGALLQEGAKALGGSLLAPGIVVPASTWLACNPDDVHRPGRGSLPQEIPVPPRARFVPEPLKGVPS